MDPTTYMHYRGTEPDTSHWETSHFVVQGHVDMCRTDCGATSQIPAVMSHLDVPVVYNTSTKESAAHNQVIVQREGRRFLPRVSTPPGCQGSPKMREHQVALRVAPVEDVCLS